MSEELSPNISTRLSVMIEEALDEIPMTPPGMSYDITFVQLPEQGIVHLVMMSASGALIGTSVTTAVAIPGASAVTKPDVVNFTTQIIDALHQQRSDQLKDAPASPIPGMNGNVG